MKITRAVLRGCYQFLHHVNAIHDWTSSMGVWEICVDRWGVWLANKRTGTPIHLPTYLAIESYVQTLRGGLTSLPRESASLELPRVLTYRARGKQAKPKGSE